MRFKLLKTAGGKPSKLSIGLSVAALVAMVGTAGVVGAAPMHKSAAKGLTASQGSGYGGTVNASVGTNVNLNVNGSRNVINLVINYIFGSSSSGL